MNKIETATTAWRESIRALADHTCSNPERCEKCLALNFEVSSAEDALIQAVDELHKSEQHLAPMLRAVHAWRGALASFVDASAHDLRALGDRRRGTGSAETARAAHDAFLAAQRAWERARDNIVDEALLLFDDAPDSPLDVKGDTSELEQLRKTLDAERKQYEVEMAHAQRSRSALQVQVSILLAAERARADAAAIAAANEPSPELLLAAERARADAAVAQAPSQDLWIKLRQELGDQEVRRLIVKKLRDFADLVECNEVSRGRVYGVRVDRLGEFPCTGDSPIEDVAVSLSRPWGG